MRDFSSGKSGVGRQRYFSVKRVQICAEKPALGQGKHSVRPQEPGNPALTLPLKGSCKGFGERSKFVLLNKEYGNSESQKSKKNVSGLSQQDVVCCVVDERRADRWLRRNC